MEFNWQSDIEFLGGLLDSIFWQEALDSEVGYGLYSSVSDTKKVECHSLEKRNLNCYFEILEVIPDLHPSACILEIGEREVILRQ